MSQHAVGVLGSKGSYLVVVMELDRVPLTVTNTVGDVRSHFGLPLSWKTNQRVNIGGLHQNFFFSIKRSCTLEL